MVEWAKVNVPKTELEAYNRVVESGDIDAGERTGCAHRATHSSRGLFFGRVDVLPAVPVGNQIRT
jgi:hypothetical protein